ncbi:MAG: hypothetical protein LC102_12210 [Ignavibacteriales bacterium]|nr:MAG: hypothetical protein F9K26_11095 [Ignavibacteriaceae bacterium]MBW7873837.1 hypothetical protein [Ignavibacteria bacterium]MCZ2144174.1 hypothetical protein [Ignavibacteriales bacterium]OQY76647.1 MAG: hypothetical protein B6D45_03395 [Ignavibacteriales bacterium UTCHB3]MBV6445813.1 hypothetical protein [Ignavibacteriaceae bacterium]
MKTSLIITFTIVTLLFFNGCKSEDNVLAPKEEHFKAEGVYLSTSGIPVASIFRGESSDTIKVPYGALSDHIDVKFFDSNRNIINPPSDPNKHLAWSIADTNITEILRHDEEYEIHFRGKQRGLTTVEFFISHDGHNDFRSGNIKVSVE